MCLFAFRITSIIPAKYPFAYYFVTQVDVNMRSVTRAYS